MAKTTLTNQNNARTFVHVPNLPFSRRHIVVYTSSPHLVSNNVTVIFNPDVADGSCVVGGVVIHKCFYSFTHYITLHIKFNPKTSNNKDKLSVINQKITPHTYTVAAFGDIGS